VVFTVVVVVGVAAGDGVVVEVPVGESPSRLKRFFEKGAIIRWEGISFSPDGIISWKYCGCDW